jgi:hypothetical protein
MKNFFNARIVRLLGIISLALVIGFSMAACSNGDDDDGNGSGEKPSGQTPGGGGTLTAVTPPAELVGVYFKSAASAGGSDITDRQFEITSAGHLISYSGAGSDSVARDFTITAAASGKISLGYVGRSGGVNTGSVDYVYDASANTLKVSNFNGGDLGNGFFSGQFSDGGNADVTYYKRTQ